MKYGSVCSGIEAATVAWHPLGWEPAFFSDVEPYPRALLRHHYPDTPLHGRDIRPKEDFGNYCDEAGFQTIGADQYGAIDLLVGGTPCQSFSVAGKRGGLGDGRGNLALEYIRLADRERPRWVVWENVPGVFSSTQGEDLRCFLSGLVRWSVPIPDGGWSNGGIIAPGPVDGSYGVAWRVLDAQYFGVPQRRRRVFVVGYLGDWRPAAAVLFERHSLQGHPAPSRKTRKDSPGCPPVRTFAGNRESSVAATIQTTCDDYSRADGFNCVSQYGLEIAGTLTHRHDSSPCADRGQNAVAVAIRTANTGANGHGVLHECEHTLDQAQGQALALPINTQIATRGEALGEGTGFGIGEDGDPAFTLQAAHSHGVAVTQYGNDAGNFACNQGVDAGHALPKTTDAWSEELTASEEVAGTIQRGGDGGRHDGVMHGMSVRRLTPVECERLQGFPDNYTAIPWRKKGPEDCPDGPRYKALGNSMAVPVMQWIGQRIQLVQDVLAQNKAIEIVAELLPPTTEEE